MRNHNLFKLCVCEICVKQIPVNQGVGVYDCKIQIVATLMRYIFLNLSCRFFFIKTSMI